MSHTPVHGVHTLNQRTLTNAPASLPPVLRPVAALDQSAPKDAQDSLHIPADAAAPLSHTPLHDVHTLKQRKLTNAPASLLPVLRPAPSIDQSAPNDTQDPLQISADAAAPLSHTLVHDVHTLKQRTLTNAPASLLLPPPAACCPAAPTHAARMPATAPEQSAPTVTPACSHKPAEPSLGAPPSVGAHLHSYCYICG